MRIKITSAGIYGASGEVPIGSEFDLQSAPPEGWNGRYIVVSEKSAAAVPVVNPAITLESIEAMDRAEVLSELESRDWSGDKRLSVDKLRAELSSLAFPKK